MENIKKVKPDCYDELVANNAGLIKHLSQDKSFISESGLAAFFSNNNANREIYENSARIYYNKGFLDGLQSSFEKPLGDETGKLLFELLNKIGIGFVYKTGPGRYGLEARDLLLEDPYICYVDQRKINTVHFKKYREILLKRIIADIDDYMIQTGMK